MIRADCALCAYTQLSAHCFACAAASAFHCIFSILLAVGDTPLLRQLCFLVMWSETLVSEQLSCDAVADGSVELALVSGKVAGLLALYGVVAVQKVLVWPTTPVMRKPERI